MDPDKLSEALEGLPPRKPRGDPQNQLRALMLPYLLAGFTPEESRKKAMNTAKALLKGILLLEKEGLEYE